MDSRTYQPLGKAKALRRKAQAIEKEFAKDMKKYKAAEATAKKTQRGKQAGPETATLRNLKSTKKAKVAPVAKKGNKQAKPAAYACHVGAKSIEGSWKAFQQRKWQQ